MEAEIGKYGIWLSKDEINIVDKSLEWFENSSHTFNETSKIDSIRNLRNDFKKIRRNGTQIPEKVEIPDRAIDEYKEYMESILKCTIKKVDMNKVKKYLKYIEGVYD
jgi:hypothetical protein